MPESNYTKMTKTVIKNVMVFDGTKRKGPETISITGSLIVQNSADDHNNAPNDKITTTIDGTGCTLLPGLIDCHVHVDKPEQLHDCARFGVTSVCDMACQPLATYQAMKASQADSSASSGTVTWISAGQPAFSANSIHGKVFRMLGNGLIDKAVHTPDDAVSFVAQRISEDVDYIKVIADYPGISQETLNRIQAEAAAKGKMTVAHTAQHGAFVRGLDAGFDILTHSPLDKKLDDALTSRMARDKIVAVPTLTMMEGFANSWLWWAMRGRQDLQNAIGSVKAMHQAGVKILVGTDTNNLPLFSVPRGESMHREMELLAQAGLSPVEILQGATSLAAEQFGLTDRGRIEIGMRADLVLVRGDPTERIEESRRIERVWVGGQEVSLAPTTASSCVMM